MNTRRRKRRSVSRAERHHWLEEVESGTAISAVAMRTGRNFNTIKSAVLKAEEERERSRARSDLYRKAIFDHNQDMLEVLGMLEGLIGVRPDELFTPIDFFPDVGTYYGDPVIRISRGELGFDWSPWDAQTVRKYGLLQEHLKAEGTLLQNLQTWQRQFEEYAESCRGFGKRVGEQVRERTGLEFVPSDGQQGGMFKEYLFWLCRRAIEAASDEGDETPERQLVFTGNELRYGGSALTRTDSNDDLQRSAQAFEALLEQYNDDAQAKGISNQRDGLGRNAEKLKAIIGDLLLLGLVTGRCRVCNRLGS